MTTFSYLYITSSGKKRKGNIDAESLQEAKSLLRERRIMVTQFVQRKARKRPLAGSHLLNFTLQLSQLIQAGVPVYESLVIIEEACKDAPFHPTLLALSEAIQKGSSLSQAMSAHPKSFNAEYCAMIAAGEEAGELPLVLKKLAEMLKKREALKKQLISALLYPAILGIFCFIVIILLLTFAVPSIKSLFEGRELTGLTAIVMHASDHWYLLPLILTPLFFIKRLPFFRNLQHLSSLAKFFRTLDTLSSGGLTLIDAMRLSREVVSDPELKKNLLKAEKRIIEGSQLSQELKSDPLIPRMLRIGEESGEPMFGHIAEHYEQALEKRLTRLTTLAQPVILIIMGGIVGLIMFAVLLPLTDVSNLF